MVSTVTVCTITVVAGASLAGGAALFATIFLICLLATKELTGTASDNKGKLINKSVSIGIIPLLIGFCVIVGLKIAEILA
jgi:hypothetical protein